MAAPQIGLRPSRIVVAALFLVSAAFQIQAPVILGAGDVLTSGEGYSNFFPAEDGLRWSREHGAIVFKEPGPRIPVRVEVLLSGWRPAGERPAEVRLSAGGRFASFRPGHGAETVSLATVTSGLWDSDLVVSLESTTFVPGAGDNRQLGVRVEEARMVPLRRGPRIPPVRALVLSAALVGLIGYTLSRIGAGSRRSEIAALAAAVVIAAGYAWARAATATWMPWLLGAAAVAALVSWGLPGFRRLAVAWLLASVRALGRGGARLGDGQVAVLLLMGTLLVGAAYRIPSGIDIDLGSGSEVAVARGMGVFDGKGGRTSRRALRGASLDLRDFGGGAPWKITVSAALDGGPGEVEVVGTGERTLVMNLEENTWTEGSMSAEAPFGWRSGLRLEFRGGSQALRLDRIHIERGTAWPSPRVGALVLLSALLALVAFGSAGLSRRQGLGAALFVLLASSAALCLEPLAAIPFAGRFFGIMAAAAFIMAGLRGAMEVLAASRPGSTLPGPGALAAAVSGWVAWLLATAFPYYRGGHFVFHSSIAEEIWKGRFLIYYLPYPGSMLSEQAQWGKIVMPHPASYQTLVAPLAALPRDWFYFLEKVVLAALFASLVLVVWSVAIRVFEGRAAAYAAVIFAGLVPGFQLLGLGHLMTILGVWTSSLVLPWLMFRSGGLHRFRIWSLTVALLTFCFLSYTAALLFTGAVLVFVVLASVRTDRPRARSVFSVLVAASALAFVLYYVHWTLPFVMDSAPKIIGGVGLGGSAREATPVLARLLLEPSKLGYSYGSLWIPLAGAASLWFLPRSWPRLILLAWVGILFFVSAADVFFNFLLKHHYYVMVPVAVGLGGLMARIEKRFGRVPPIVLTLIILGLGLKTAVEAALGLIP